MGKKKVEYKLSEIGGDRYPGLEAAQETTREPLVEILVAVIRRKLTNGELVVVDGKPVIHGREED